MTWQRIDEDTYIDNSLVTCAEYQLFIDEMREQGKYYQPDHWASYRFPEGQGREPILGVRHSDAVAFCEWLTAHEGEKWKFHLATLEEAITFPIKSKEVTPLGYWSSGDNQFAWIGLIPKDARAFDRTIISNDPTIFKSEEDMFGSINYRSNRELENALASVVDQISNHPFDLGLYQRRERSITLSVSDTISLSNEIDRIRDRSPSIDISTKIEIASQRVRSLVDTMPLDSYGYLENSPALEIYIDILTLQERIAGRSPAFEGIRLVKERIR